MGSNYEPSAVCRSVTPSLVYVRDAQHGGGPDLEHGGPRTAPAMDFTSLPIAQFGPKIAAKLAELDTDGDGKLSASELLAGITALHREKAQSKNLFRLSVGLAVFTMLLLMAFAGVMFLLIDITKESNIRPGGVMYVKGTNDTVKVGLSDMNIKAGVLYPSGDAPGCADTGTCAAALQTSQAPYQVRLLSSTMSDKNFAQMKTIQLGAGTNTFTTDVYAFSRREVSNSQHGTVITFFSMGGKVFLDGSTLSYDAAMDEVLQDAGVLGPTSGRRKDHATRASGSFNNYGSDAGFPDSMGWQFDSSNSWMFNSSASAPKCPFFETCSEAREWCNSTLRPENNETIQNMTFKCHSGSEVARFGCNTPANTTNCTGNVSLTSCAQQPVVLGSASLFAILAGATVTSTGPSRITGHLGVYPGSAVTGFPPGEMVGLSAIQSANGMSLSGIADLTTAYFSAAGRVLCPISVSGNLGGMTLTPGLYKSTSGLSITGTSPSSDLTLDAGDDSEAIFIFQMASTFTSAAGRKVVLTKGAKASNIFWQVGTSATLGAGTVLEGTMMADQSISLGINAVVNGRVLARIAAVTMISDTVTIPAL